MPAAGTPAATGTEVLGRPVPVTNGPVLHVGLDVHTESIAVSLAPSEGSEVRRYGMIGGTHDDVLRLAKKLQAAHPDSALRFCYEAGPHGYQLNHSTWGDCLRKAGLVQLRLEQ